MLHGSLVGGLFKILGFHQPLVEGQQHIRPMALEPNHLARTKAIEHLEQVQVRCHCFPEAGLRSPANGFAAKARQIAGDTAKCARSRGHRDIFGVFGLFDFLVEQGIHATEERQGHLASARVVVGHFVDPSG